MVEKLKSKKILKIVIEKFSLNFSGLTDHHQNTKKWDDKTKTKKYTLI